MRELRSCDFCDAEAVGAFEIVPPELEPTEAEQRRVVPCADCKDRLETLLEPLLARAGAESGAGAGPADGDPDSTGDDETDGSGAVVATADESTEKRPRTTSPNATVSETPAESEDGTTSQPADEADPDSDSESDAEPGLEGGITFERDERTDDAAAGSAGEDGDEPADGATSKEAAETGDASNAAAADDAESTGSSNRPPTAYNKVVRLLRNREFPMKRTAVEELAAGAYDLESHEVEAIVDYAVEDGEFVEKGGLLRRP
ncbi:hypothetical protein [Natrinema versiforme]|uniref:Uncharacterized protein n=1 Tax=Natrinema versiforme TaxID=88724 RepID=A0A4V1FX59_9EURY|nr:hypothetical protein [Natrinema versiforme]QCS40860.1 hypothetical protein FEJ81_00315 [Natrinema versiforme]